MHHTKLIVFGIVLAVVIIFGFIFWDDFKFNQQELSNTPLPPSPVLDEKKSVPASNQQSADQEALSGGDDYDDLEKDLNETNLNLDSDNAELESEMSGL
jgi:cytoskeletal protein RodZ